MRQIDFVCAGEEASTRREEGKWWLREENERIDYAAEFKKQIELKRKKWEQAKAKDERGEEEEKFGKEDIVATKKEDGTAHAFRTPASAANRSRRGGGEPRILVKFPFEESMERSRLYCKDFKASKIIRNISFLQPVSKPHLNLGTSLTPSGL